METKNILKSLKSTTRKIKDMSKEKVKIKYKKHEDLSKERECYVYRMENALKKLKFHI